MSIPGGGGGGGLPPLTQQINVVVNGANNAHSVFGNIAAGAAGATRALGGVGAATNSMGYSLLRAAPSWRTFGDALRMTGSLLKYTIAMPLINVGKQAIKLAEDFEDSMSKIQGLVGMTAEDVNIMSKAVLGMAGDVAKAPGELADALYFVTSAGIRDTSKALDVLDMSARAASAGLGTTKDIADLTTSVMNAYAPGTYDAGTATDTLVAAVREGKAEASEFAPAMGKVIPVAAAFGVKFQDVAATMAALTRQGAAAGTSAIYLRQVLNSLLDPTQKAEEKLKEVGLSAGLLRSTIQEQGLMQGLMMLKQGFGDNAEAISQVFGNVRAMTAIFGLLGPNLAMNQQIFADLSNNLGDTDRAFNVASDTLKFKFDAASAEAKTSLINLGYSMTPVMKQLSSLMKGLAKMMNIFTRNKPLVQTTMFLGAMAIAVATLVKTWSTFIRLRTMLSTIMLALGNGITDMTTGVARNVVTQKLWQSMSFQNVGALTGVTGATTAATAATATHAAATAAAGTALVNQNNTILQNIIGLRTLIMTQTGASATSALLAAGLRAVGRAALVTLAPMLAMTLAFVAFKKLFDLFKRAKKPKEVFGLTQDIRSLTDATSNFKAKPLVVGVDVSYGGGAAEFGGTPTAFEDFIFGKDAEGKMNDAGKRIKKKIEEIAKRTSEESRIRAATVIYASFSQDPKTAKAAAEWIGNALKVSPTEIQNTLADSLKDPGKYIRATLEESVGGIDTQSLFSSLFVQNPLAPLGPADEAVSAVQRLKAIIKENADFTLLGKDAIDIQSAQQWVETLRTIYDETIKAGGGTQTAEAVTLQYANSAMKAAGGSEGFNSILELMNGNSIKVQGNLKTLNSAVQMNADANNDGVVSMTEWLSAASKLDQVTQSASESVKEFVDDIQSVSSEFAEGYQNSIQDSINMMKAYEDALKSIKEAQDALYGAQLDNVDAQIAYRNSLRDTMANLKDSNGEIYTQTANADASLKSMGELAKSIMDVGNAAYAEAEGDASKKAAAAAAAVNEAYRVALLNLKDSGISGADLEKYLTDTLGGVSLDGVITFTPDVIMKTFSNGATQVSGQLGTDIMDGINTAIASSDAEISNSISEVLANAIKRARDLLQAASPSKKTKNEIGIPMGQGIVAGINQVKGDVEAASAALAASAVTAAKNKLKIKSPSQVFAQGVGAPIAEGMAVGISSGVSAMAAAASAAVSTVYDVVAKNQGNKKVDWKKISTAQMQTYAEGILEGKSKVKSSIIQLVDEIMSEIDDQLGKIETSISARLDFAQAQADLAKFQNEQKGFASVLSKAQREQTQATMKYGAAGEVTRYERSQIATSAKSAQQAQRDYALGKISYAQLVDAQTEYANTSASATEMSSDVISANNAVIDAQFNVTNSSMLLAQEQMKVVTAQADLNKAYVDATIAGNSAITTMNGLITQIGNLGTASSNIALSMAQSFGMSPSMTKLVSGATRQQSNVNINRNKNIKWTAVTSGSTSGRSNVKSAKRDDQNLRNSAAGGSVASGMPYIVGELGPELFIPRQGGTIIPTTALERYAPSRSASSSSSSSGDGNQINVTINNPVPETASDSIARRVQNMSALGLFG